MDVLLIALITIASVSGSQPDTGVDIVNDVNMDTSDIETSGYKVHENMDNTLTSIKTKGQNKQIHYKVITQEQRRHRMESKEDVSPITVRHETVEKKMSLVDDIGDSGFEAVSKSESKEYVSPITVLHEKVEKKMPLVDDIGDSGFEAVPKSESKEYISPITVFHEKVEKKMPLVDDIGDSGFEAVSKSVSNIGYEDQIGAGDVPEESYNLQYPRINQHDSFGHGIVEEEEETFTHKPTPLNTMMHSKYNENIHDGRHTLVKVNSVGTGIPRYADGYFHKNPSVIVDNGEVNEYPHKSTPFPAGFQQGLKTLMHSKYNENIHESMHAQVKLNSVGTGISMNADEHFHQNPSVVGENGEVNEYLHKSTPFPADSQQGFQTNQGLPLITTAFPFVKRDHHDIIIQREIPTEETEEESSNNEQNGKGLREPNSYSPSSIFSAEGGVSNPGQPQILVGGILQPIHFPFGDAHNLVTRYPHPADESPANGFGVPIEVLHAFHLQAYPEEQRLKLPYPVRHQPILHHVDHSLRYGYDPSLEQIQLGEGVDHDVAFHVEDHHRFSPSLNSGLNLDQYSPYSTPSLS